MHWDSLHARRARCAARAICGARAYRRGLNKELNLRAAGVPSAAAAAVSSRSPNCGEGGRLRASAGAAPILWASQAHNHGDARLSNDLEELCLLGHTLARRQLRSRLRHRVPLREQQREAQGEHNHHTQLTKSPRSMGCT